MNKSTIKIDRRPMVTVLWERFRSVFFLVVFFVALSLFLLGPQPQGLSDEGFRALGVFGLCSLLWITQLIPLPVTGLLAIGLVPALGILSAEETFSFFGNSAVFFILGAFILAAAMLRSGLSTRITLTLLGGTKADPRSLVRRILVSSAFLSCFISEHAVAMLLFPMILSIVKALELEPFGGAYGKSLFLALAWGCVIGGIVTFLGGARAPLAIGFLEEFSGRSLNFLQWMRVSIFVAVPLLLSAYFILTRAMKVDVESVESAQKILESKQQGLGRLRIREFLVGVVFALTLIVWIFFSNQIGLVGGAIFGVVLLFVLKLVTWREMEKHVNWGIILMYGGAITLGRAIATTGTLDWLLQKCMWWPQSLSAQFGGFELPWMIAIFSVLSVFLTELISNAAVVALLMPLAIRSLESLGGVPDLAAFAVALPSGLAFILPIATPAMAIAYSSGYIKLKEILLPGLILNFLGVGFCVLAVLLNYF